jgi:hypothetical protein
MRYLVRGGFEFKMSGDTTHVKTARMTHFPHPAVIDSEARRTPRHRERSAAISHRGEIAARLCRSQ